MARQLQARRSAGAGIGALLAQARNAFAAGRLDDGDSSALPLFQRILALQPENLPALEGREDALSDLLQHARALAGRGELAEAAATLQRARLFDAGHADLPASQEALARAVDERLRQAQRALQRQQLERAAKGFLAVLAVAPDDPTAQRGREQVLQAVLARSQIQADDSSSRRRSVMPCWPMHWALRRRHDSNWCSACSVHGRPGRHCSSPQ